MSKITEKIQKGAFDVPKFILNMDMFGEQVPEINVRGETKIKSSIGAWCTLTIIALTIAFGIVKLEHLV